jgi:hypothetical protein
MNRRELLQLMGSSVIATALPEITNSETSRTFATTAVSKHGTAYGSGHFGQWITDPFGLPAYRYTCDQVHDPKAISPTDAVFRAPTDQFHQIGNGRVVALASNYGYIQLREDEGGAKFLNDYNPQQGHYGGGIGYLNDGKTTLATYYPGDAESFERVFGMGYLRKTVRGGGYAADHVIFAPFGDDPVLVSQVTIRNDTRAAATLKWTEYWGCQTYEFCNYQGDLTETEQHLERRRVADQFRHRFEPLPGQMGLVERKRFEGTPPKFQTGPGGAHEADLAPPATFLASLGDMPTALACKGSAFLGAGGIREPDGVRSPLDEELSEQGKNAALILQQSLTLAPGESRTLHFLYGYLTEGAEAAALIARCRQDIDTLFARSCAQWKRDGIEFKAAEEPWAEREITWSHYYLRSGMTFEDFTGEHVLSQGHTYQYIQGGAVGGRDMVNHVLPFIYTHPDLVKEDLRYYCKILRTDGSIADTTGYGMVSPSRAPDNGPSDVDLWLLWTAAEYILATRDLAFLDEEVVTYPLHGPGSGKAKVRDCLARAWEFQTKVVGRGKHGLMRSLTGDWNDNLQLDSCPPKDTVQCRTQGESVMNSAMAGYVYDLYASLREFAGAPAAEVDAIRAEAESHRQAVRAQWTGRWFRRAWFGPDRGWAGEGDNFWLEPQPWAIVGGAATEEQKRILVGNIDKLVRRPSPIGAMLGNKGNREFGKVGERVGQAEDGGVWPAINQTLVWALGKVDAAMAWDEWKKNTLARHAEAYPDIWYGIWSGPDTYNSTLNKNPGQTMISDIILQPRGVEPGMFSYATDFGMVDFPVMNMHPHSTVINALTKLVGAEFSPDGLTLTPALPLASYSFGSPLLGLERSPSGYSGWYAPSGKGGNWTIRLLIPDAARFGRLRVNGAGKLMRAAAGEPVLISGYGDRSAPLRWSLS